MSFKREKYSADKMAKHLDYLKMYEQEGEPLEYEILIDGMRAIRRTNNTNRFLLYENFITEESCKVELIIYQGSSNHNDKFIYYLKDEPKEAEQTLGEIDNRIEEKVKEAERKWQYEQIIKENKTLKEEVAELEQELELLEKEKQAREEKESPLRGYLGEVGASLLESFIRNNPQMMRGIPGGTALSGLLDKSSKPEVETEDAEVSFKSAEPRRNEEEQGLVNFARELKATFTKEEFPSVIEILQSLAVDKTKINDVMNYLKSEHHE